MTDRNELVPAPAGTEWHIGMSWSYDALGSVYLFPDGVTLAALDLATYDLDKLAALGYSRKAAKAKAKESLLVLPLARENFTRWVSPRRASKRPLRRYLAKHAQTRAQTRAQINARTAVVLPTGPTPAGGAR